MGSVARGGCPDSRHRLRWQSIGRVVAPGIPQHPAKAALFGFAAYLAALYLAGIRIAVLLGSSLTRHESDSLRDFGVALLVGLIVLAVAESIPFLGVLVQVVIVLVGLGLLAQQAMILWGRRSAGAV